MNESGVQECRSAGVQEFRSSGVQEFRSSGVQEWRSGVALNRLLARANDVSQTSLLLQLLNSWTPELLHN
jgi:hypothetical protein